MIARSYGGLLVALGVANWMAGKEAFANNRYLWLANLVWHPLSAMVILQAALAGDVNAMAYGFLAVHAFWTIGFAGIVIGVGKED